MSNHIKPALAILLLFAAVSALHAFGKKDAPKPGAAPVYDSGYYDSAAEGQLVVITGTVRLVGSDPFPRYVITEAGKYDWYIPEAEDRALIAGFEQQTVTVQGTVKLRELVLANGKRLGFERELVSINLASK